MTFTDDDLKWLKDETRIHADCKPTTCLHSSTETIKLMALIARLEAAEALIADYPQYELEMEAKRQAWRKAAGK